VNRFGSRNRKNCSQNFQVLRLQVVITPQRLQMPKTHGQMAPPTGCLSIFTVRITSKSSAGDCTLRIRKGLTDIFGNVRCPILSNSTLQCWCGPEPYIWLWCCLVSDILKKNRLNWKLKVSNTADNAGITQSHARDTRYRKC